MQPADQPLSPRNGHRVILPRTELHPLKTGKVKITHRDPPWFLALRFLLT